MGALQTTNYHRKRSRVPPLNKAQKHHNRLRTTMQSITLRSLAGRNDQNSVSSSYDSTTNNSCAYTSPTSITTINSQLNSEPYLSDFDYRKLSTLTGLSEAKINELHREFLMLSINGRLTFEQYKSMLETIPNQNGLIQLNKLARQTFALFDKDGNNYLDFAEFLAAYITMEKNELSPTHQTYSPAIPPAITSVTRQATSYYSPQKSSVNTSPQKTYIRSNYPSYHPHSQMSKQYLYTSAQYRYR